MIVVADASPLIVLVNIGCVDVLPKLFQEVTIPPQIAVELASTLRPQAVRDFIAHRPSWLIERKPAGTEKIPKLDLGEREAISLARELHAELLLIDEVLGRKAALGRKLRIAGTIGVLEMAAAAKMVDLADVFERVKKTDFWISHQLLDERA